MNSDQLRRFREEWVNELGDQLKSAETELNPARVSLDDQRRDDINIEKRAGRTAGEGHAKRHKNVHFDSEDENSCSKKKQEKCEKQENLLEILIADIDELISLPFFDLELPKEIALNIFGYLTVKDLGHCACVNRSWRTLADDDLLWFELCRNCGYIGADGCAVEREGWKDIFKELSQGRERFEQNWKQRICQTSELEYEKGGILYAASVFGNSVIAGYANGLMKLWDIFSESPTASFGILLSETESDRTSSIQSVSGNGSVLAAGYSNVVCHCKFNENIKKEKEKEEAGDVKIWQNGLDFSLIESFNFETKIDFVSVAAKSASVISTSGRKFRIDAANDNGQWNNVFLKTLDQNIKSVYLYDGADFPSVIHTQSCVQLYGRDGEKHQLEFLDHSLSAEISSVACNEHVISLGITPFGYSIIDGYRIKTFSPENGCLRQLMKGPNCKISCLGMSSAQNNLVAAGCFDKRIRLHDARFEYPFMALKGLTAVPCSLQIDEWKVIAGDMKGNVSVWDQRSQSLLWQTAARHPVKICRCVGPCLVCVSLPIDRNPKETLWYMDDLVQHRRHRGTIRIYDFTADNNTTGIPDICQSNYDDYAGFNYNINLTTPYDIIDTY